MTPRAYQHPCYNCGRRCTMVILDPGGRNAMCLRCASNFIAVDTRDIPFISKLAFDRADEERRERIMAMLKRVTS